MACWPHLASITDILELYFAVLGRISLQQGDEHMNAREQIAAAIHGYATENEYGDALLPAYTDQVIAIVRQALLGEEAKKAGALALGFKDKPQEKRGTKGFDEKARSDELIASAWTVLEATFDAAFGAEPIEKSPNNMKLE